MPLNLVLVEPEIPQNTGNIARTCAAVGARLHLVRPLGFAVTDRHLKRAGMDYWAEVEVIFHDSRRAFLEAAGSELLWLATSKGGRAPDQVPFGRDPWIVLGRESRGLDEDFLASRPDTWVRLPMRPGTRSLNVSNAAAILVYEALRQEGWPGLSLSP